MIPQTIDCWALAAWCGINLVIPVAAPLLVLWLFGRPRTTAPMAGRNVLKSIGKGELFWAAMGMSAATCYELYSLQKILVDQNGIGLAWVGFWIHLFLILFSVIYVGIGSLSAAVVGRPIRTFPTRPCSARRLRPWFLISSVTPQCTPY